MKSMLSRAIAAVRVWLGMNDPADNHLYADHGWLLPLPTDVLAGKHLAPVPVAIKAPTGEGR